MLLSDPVVLWDSALTGPEGTRIHSCPFPFKRTAEHTGGEEEEIWGPVADRGRIH